MRWCAAANPAELLPHKRTAPLRMRRVPPKRVLCCFRVEPAHRVATPTDLVASTQSHKRKAATVVIDTEALVCSGWRCSSP